MAISEKLLWPEREGHLFWSKRGVSLRARLPLQFQRGPPRAGPRQVLIGSISGHDGQAQAFVSLHRGWFRAIWVDLADQCASLIKLAC